MDVVRNKALTFLLNVRQVLQSHNRLDLFSRFQYYLMQFNQNECVGRAVGLRGGGAPSGWGALG